MLQCEKSWAAKQVVTWVAERADILFLAYHAAGFVGQVFGPLERTSAVLEDLLPDPQEIWQAEPENVQWLPNQQVPYIPRSPRPYQRRMAGKRKKCIAHSHVNQYSPEQGRTH